MSDRRRRTLLTVLFAGLVVSAGCTATPDGAGSGTPTLSPASPSTDSPSGSPTGGPSGPPSVTPDRCVAVERSVVDPFREDVEPSERPEPPGEWNRSSVERYVVAFEEAYARNGALRADTERVEVIVGDVAVERSDETWVVELTSRTNTWARGRGTGTATATVVHGDGPHVPVTYHLTDRALYREEERIGGTPSSSATSSREPRHGRAVACFETQRTPAP
jgi:hypothetical protein